MVAMKRSLLIAVLTGAGAFGQYRPLAPFVLPDDIAARKVDIMSAGVRMSGEVFSAKALAGEKLPTIVMSHGWGGTVAGLRRDAAEFAEAGYLVVAFDYRGWGLSDSRVILTGRARPIRRIIASPPRCRRCARWWIRWTCRPTF